MKRKNGIALLLALVLLVAGCANTERDWQEQYDLGMRYLDEGDYDEAILAFSAAIEIDGSRPEAYMGRAEAYVAIGEPEKALKDYKKAKRAAKNSDEDYDHLIDELEELIGAMEEELEQSENAPDDRETDGESGDDEAFQVTVTDAFSDSVTDMYSSYCYHIPRINLKDDLAEGVNAQIFDMLYTIIDEEVYEYTNQYGYAGCGNILYTWGIRDGIVSVTVMENRAEWDWTTYYVFNVSIETGELVSDEELLAVFGLDMDGFYELARSTLKLKFDYPEEVINVIGRDFYDYIVTMTLSEESLSQAMPFIGPDGSLCMAAMQYSVAGAAYYWHAYDLENVEQQLRISCEVDHSAPAAAYTAGEVTRMVADWYNNNVGGYENGTHAAFEGETTVSDGKYLVVVRFQSSDPAYTGGANILVTVAEVDMTTGEMWSDGIFRGYLW